MRCKFKDFRDIRPDEGNVSDLSLRRQPNEYREASRRALAFIFSLIDYLSQYRNARELENRFWSLASALEHHA